MNHCGRPEENYERDYSHTHCKEEVWIKEFDDKFPHWNEYGDFPRWMAFGGICEHDDGFICKERLGLIKSFIRSLIEQKEITWGKIIADITKKNTLASVSEAIGKLRKPDNGHSIVRSARNDALDAILKVLHEV